MRLFCVFCSGAAAIDALWAASIGERAWSIVFGLCLVVFTAMIAVLPHEAAAKKEG